MDWAPVWPQPMSWASPMTRLHTPVVAVRVPLEGQLRRPLHREHGGLGQNFPIGLAEGPPVFAGGNDVLQDLNGLGAVAYPSVKAGGVVITSLEDFGFSFSRGPYLGRLGWNGGVECPFCGNENIDDDDGQPLGVIWTRRLKGRLKESECAVCRKLWRFEE